MARLDITRIKQDLKEFFKDPLPEVFLVPSEADVTVCHAIIVGPVDTPYEGGFFYFFIRFPADYPMVPPSVKLMTTSQAKVRFNPNLYSTGKVCLSILGTWKGPAWSPANNLATVLLSIQSLMNEKPYHNEPGHEEDSEAYKKLVAAGKDPVKPYNDTIRHETIRVAVIDMMDEANLDTKQMPNALREKIVEVFKRKVGHYEKVINENMPLNGKPMVNQFGRPIGKFDYKSLSKKLAKVKGKIPVQKAISGTSPLYDDFAKAHKQDEPFIENGNDSEANAKAALEDVEYYTNILSSSEDEDDPDELCESDEDDDQV